MFWNIASLIGSIVTIASAGFSLFAWIKTKEYYQKITLIEDIEKIDIALLDIKNSKAQYNQILSIFGNDRGAENVESIKKKFNKIKEYLQNIENELPPKYQEIYDLCREPINYLDKVIGGMIECKNSIDFEHLQSNINLAQQKLKGQRDLLRGVK